MLKKFLIIGLPLAAVGALIAFVVMTSGGEDGENRNNKTEQDAQQQRTLKGIGLSPKSFEGADFRHFFSKAVKGADVILWGGTWESLGAENSAPKVISELSEQYKYTPAIIVDIPTDAFTSEDKLQNLKEVAVSFVEEHKPKYIGLGNEVNFYYDIQPEEYDARMEFYGEVYDAIKEVSEETQVFTVFQLESMKGLQGGLFGGKNSPATLSQWDLLDKAEKFDLIAFTSYPGLIYKHPDEIPESYFSDILKHTDKPIAFSETGWFREGPNDEWASDVREQERYIRKLPGLMSGVNPRFITWLFLYDQQTREPFTTMGLLSPEEDTSAAWQAWQLIRL